jgi:hypothetical protein
LNGIGAGTPFASLGRGEVELLKKNGVEMRRENFSSKKKKEKKNLRRPVWRSLHAVGILDGTIRRIVVFYHEKNKFRPRKVRQHRGQKSRLDSTAPNFAQREN